MRSDRHPKWCDRRHLPDWALHTADLGQVETYNARAVLAVSVSQQNRLPATVDLQVEDNDEPTTYSLGLGQARRLRDILAAAVEAIEAEGDDR